MALDIVMKNMFKELGVDELQAALMAGDDDDVLEAMVKNMQDDIAEILS